MSVADLEAPGWLPCLREGLGSQANPLEPSPDGVVAPRRWTRWGGVQRSSCFGAEAGGFQGCSLEGQGQEADYHSACFLLSSFGFCLHVLPSGRPALSSLTRQPLHCFLPSISHLMCLCLVCICSAPPSLNCQPSEGRDPLFSFLSAGSSIRDIAVLRSAFVGWLNEHLGGRVVSSGSVLPAM